MLARLDSPHVLAIFDHGEHEGHPFIAMQLAAGGDLGRLLRVRGALPPALAARVCAQVADALVAAHGVGVVHRDVKPANVLLRDADPGRLDRLHAYLSDFGVALTAELTTEGGLTAAGAIAGTWSYLAPERARGEHGTPASDVYAVGCLFHEVLTGRPPFAGSDVEVAMQHVSSPVPQLPGTDETTLRVNQVLARSMAKAPADRYPTAAALRDHLRELAGTLPGAPAASVPVIADHPSRGRRRRGTIAAVVAGVLVLGGVGTAVPSPGAAVGTHRARTRRRRSRRRTRRRPHRRRRTRWREPAVGDLDGDGLGDVAWADFERTTVVRSARRRWRDPARRPIRGPDVLLGDVTGDGTPDLVSIDGSAPTIVAAVRDGDEPVVSSPLDVPVQRGELDPDHLLADVDGDGRDDVVVAHPRGREETELLVALARDDTTFEPTRRWYRGPLNPVESHWAVGDLDGDGDDDLVLGTGDDLNDQRTTFRLVRSTGSAFETAGSLVGTDTRSDDELLSSTRSASRTSTATAARPRGLRHLQRRRRRLALDPRPRPVAARRRLGRQQRHRRRRPRERRPRGHPLRRRRRRPRRPRHPRHRRRARAALHRLGVPVRPGLPAAARRRRRRPRSTGSPSASTDREAGREGRTVVEEVALGPLETTRPHDCQRSQDVPHGG